MLDFVLKLVDFINTYSDWKDRLSKPPFCVTTKRKDGYIIFTYTQRGLKNTSDFSLELVRECRGIILDETNNFKPVCVPFFKFANYGEFYADQIDWSTSRVIEKIDGSLMKVWFGKGKWMVSTSGVIDATDANVGANGLSYMDIFSEAWEQSGGDYNMLNTDYTYMFELVSPKTQVVIPQKETKLYHIGTRNNCTMVEVDDYVGFEKPTVLAMPTLESVIEAANNLDSYHEGFVVIDNLYRRIKIKSPLYVTMHHVLGNCTNDKNVLEIIVKGEDYEVLSYFPEHAPIFNKMRHRLEKFIADNEMSLSEIQAATYETRKELAARVTKTVCPGCLFAVIDGKSPSVRAFVESLSSDSLHRYLQIQSD